MLPATLEETAESGPNRRVTWVQDTKPTTDKKVNEGTRAEISPHNDASEQPPDYSQLMGRQQYNPQTQFVFQSLNAGQYQYSFPVFNQQGPFIQPNPSQIHHMNTMEGLARRPTEEDMTEKMKRKLEQRKIPEENWHFYGTSMI